MRPLKVLGSCARPYRDAVSPRTAPGTRSMVVGWSAEDVLPIAQALVYKACGMVRRGRRQWRRPEGAPPRRGRTSPTQSPAHCTRRGEEADALHRATAALRRLARRQAIGRQSVCTVANGANSDVAQQGNAAPRGAHWRLYCPTERCTRPPLPSTTTATPPERLWRGHTPAAPRPPQPSPSPLRGASQCATHTPQAPGAMLCHPQPDVLTTPEDELHPQVAPADSSESPSVGVTHPMLCRGWHHPVILLLAASSAARTCRAPSQATRPSRGVSPSRPTGARPTRARASTAPDRCSRDDLEQASWSGKPVMAAHSADFTASVHRR